MQCTISEEYYRRLIIQRISFFEQNPAKRCLLFYDFHNNSSDYYDRLCDLLYEMSTDNNLKSNLWLMPSGNVYNAQEKKHEEDSLLISSEDIPPFDGDLDAQFSLIWMNICKSMSPFCSMIYREGSDKLQNQAAGC